MTGDGAPSAIEDGAPNGGDGNNDGIPDRAQMNVASLPSPITGKYITLVASPNMTLTNVGFAATPPVGGDSLPDDVEFSLGFPTFSVSGMGAGGSAVVTLYRADGTTINGYRKYDSVNGWYKFRYDDATGTGAELLPNRILLYFVDGGRGDSDLSANGVVTDPGGPVYERPSYDLTVTVSGGGSVSQPSGTFVEGTVLTLTATADPGWVFSAWGGALSGNLLTETLTMDGDKNVVAVFTREQYSLARRVVGSGSISAAPNQGSYLYGDVVALTATPAAGWSFGGWSGDLAGGNTTENITIDANKVVTATFTQNSYTVSAGVNGSGSVVLNPQQASYRYGDVVLVEAVPAPGNAFQSWSGDLSGDGKGRSLLIDGNKSVTALFATAVYSVATEVQGGGSITLVPDQATYNYGDVVAVTATADPGWRFVEWQVGLSGNNAAEQLTVSENTTLVAVFEKGTYSLNVGWIGAGTAQKLSDRSVFEVGEVVTVTATADAGHSFSGWRDAVSNAPLSTNLTTTVTMTEDKDIVAIFDAPLYGVTVNIVGSGTVTPTKASYALGEVAELTAIADAGWTFAGWSGDLSGSNAVESITVDGNKTVTATFTAAQQLDLDRTARRDAWRGGGHQRHGAAGAGGTGRELHHRQRRRQLEQPHRQHRCQRRGGSALHGRRRARGRADRPLPPRRRRCRTTPSSTWRRERAPAIASGRRRWGLHRGQLAPNHLQVVKLGAGTPIMGVPAESLPGGDARRRGRLPLCGRDGRGRNGRGCHRGNGALHGDDERGVRTGSLYLV